MLKNIPVGIKHIVAKLKSKSTFASFKSGTIFKKTRGMPYFMGK
jgi:hypothetical protein